MLCSPDPIRSVPWNFADFETWVTRPLYTISRPNVTDQAGGLPRALTEHTFRNPAYPAGGGTSLSSHLARVSPSPGLEPATT